MTEHPRITYQCSGRTFDRLFKEQSLDETKNVVRKKLGLGHDAAVELAQLRDGKRVDLEDDDDFEAFKALTKTSLHATVTVIIRNNGRSSSNPVGKNTPGRRRRNPNGREATQSPLVQQPSTHFIDTPRPRKKRKVAFNGDLVTSADPQPSQQLALEDIRPSSPCEGSPTTVHKSSEAVALSSSGPTTLHPASQAENVEADSAADPAETSLKKRKKRNSVPLEKGPSAEPRASNSGDVIMSPHTRKKRRKDQPSVSVIPIDDNATPTGTGTGDAERSRNLPPAPATGDASLLAGIEVTNPDMTKQAKTPKQKSRPVDAEGSTVTKSKTGSVVLTEDKTPDLKKPLKRKALKKKVEPEVSKAGLDDDIDKTIAAFFSKKLQSDSSTFSDPAASAGKLAVPVDDPPHKTKHKGDKVKLGAGMNGAVPTVAQRTPNRVESMEKSGAEASIIGEVNGRPTPEPNVAGGEPHGSQSGSQLGSATLTSCPAFLGTLVHPSVACPVVQGGLDSIESRITQIEKSPGLGPSSEVVKFAEKARSIPSDSGDGSSDMEPSQVSVPSVVLHRGSSTGAKPKIPSGHEISEVRVETRGEGSSDESSTEGENDGDNPTQHRTPVNASSLRLHPQDHLVPLLHDSAKRGPRKSVLDEIPSSSETESKSRSSSEDLVLDEEEDLSLQPSHKQRKKISITRPSSIEPEFASEDEEDFSVLVYMDTSHDVLDHTQVLAIGGSGDHESIDAEVEASGRPEVDTHLREAGNQDHPISPQSQSSTKIFGSASPKLDATAINAEAPNSPDIDSTEQRTGRVLVPSSSPDMDGTTANTVTGAQSQDANDDVESAVEPPGGDEESDPIEPEPTQPLADRPSRRTDPVSRGHQRRASSTVLNPPPVSDQPSRRSNRLANRVSNSGATLVPLTQVRRRMTSALEKSGQPAKEENGAIDHDAEEAPREKSVRKQVGKPGNKPVRSTDSGDDATPSVAREDGPPISHLNLPPSEQTKSNTPSVVDGSRTSSQGPLGKLSQSTLGAEKKTPLPTGRVLVPSQKEKGNTQPLFIPGSSQVPRHPSPSPSGSEDESEIAASLLSRKTPTKSMPRSSSQFRRLTDFTSNNTLFSKSKAAQRQFKNTPSVEVLRFDASDDGEDDDEGSSSSDDRAPSSHIPKERRAGASMGRKGRGLSSLGDK